MRILFGITLALSIAGAVLLLTTGFPKDITIATIWYYFEPDIYWVGLFIFLPLLVICMLVMALLSLIVVSSRKPNISNVVRQAGILAIVILALAVVAGIVIVVNYAPFSYLWTPGFYFVLVVGVVNTILYSVYLRKSRAPLPVVEQPVVEATPRPVKQGETAKEPDFSRKLKKLAEARDQGIITQEEFENKKKQILRDID